MTDETTGGYSPKPDGNTGEERDMSAQQKHDAKISEALERVSAAQAAARDTAQGTPIVDIKTDEDDDIERAKALIDADAERKVEEAIREGKEIDPNDMDEESQQNLGKAAHLIDNRLSEDEATQMAGALAMLRSKIPLTLEQIDQAAEPFMGKGFTKASMREILDKGGFDDLDQESRETFLNKFPETSEEAQTPEEEIAQRQAQLDAISGLAEAESAATAAAIAEMPDSPEKTKHEEHLSRLGHRMKELKEWLHPDDPKKEWALRGGKALWWLAIIAFLLIVWEMNMLHKMAGKKR